MQKNFPFPGFDPFGINCQYHTLGTKCICSILQQSWILHCRRIYRYLVRTIGKHSTDILNCANSATYSQRHKALFGGFLNDIQNNIPLFMTGRNIQKNQFISTGPVVGPCSFHRIPRIAKIHKFNPFDDTAVIDVQTGNNTFGQHSATPASGNCHGFLKIYFTRIKCLTYNDAFNPVRFKFFHFDDVFYGTYSP